MRKRQAPKHAAPKADVPPELQSQDYGFPRVHLPASRPHPSPQQLHDALADDDTQPMAPVQPQMRIVDRTPQPARHEGLSPAAVPAIPVPSLPFLNSAVRVEPPLERPRAEVIVREGSALPPRLTGAELMILGKPVPNDAPPAPQPRVRHTFDRGFWTQLHQHTDRAHAVAESLAAANDRRDSELTERLARLEQMHRDMIAQHDARPLPRRIPGRALAAIEAFVAQQDLLVGAR